jgi:hypothetical protein
MNISPLKRELVFEDGKRLKNFPIVVKQGATFGVLGGDAKIGDVDAVEFLYVARMTAPWQWERLNLPSAIGKAVVHFLANYYGRQNMAFGCYEFANLVNSVPPHDKFFALEHWDFNPVCDLPAPGNTIFLMNDDINVFVHAAVYLGHHIYLSVYGMGGDIVVSSLQDMLNDFGAKWIWLATPRT